MEKIHTATSYQFIYNIIPPQGDCNWVNTFCRCQNSVDGILLVKALPQVVVNTSPGNELQIRTRVRQSSCMVAIYRLTCTSGFSAVNCNGGGFSGGASMAGGFPVACSGKGVPPIGGRLVPDSG